MAGFFGRRAARAARSYQVWVNDQTHTAGCCPTSEQLPKGARVVAQGVATAPLAEQLVACVRLYWGASAPPAEQPVEPR